MTTSSGPASQQVPAVVAPVTVGPTSPSDSTDSHRTDGPPSSTIATPVIPKSGSNPHAADALVIQVASAARSYDWSTNVRFTDEERAGIEDAATHVWKSVEGGIVSALKAHAASIKEHKAEADVYRIVLGRMAQAFLDHVERIAKEARDNERKKLARDLESALEDERTRRISAEEQLGNLRAEHDDLRAEHDDLLAEHRDLRDNYIKLRGYSVKALSRCPDISKV